MADEKANYVGRMFLTGSEVLVERTFSQLPVNPLTFTDSSGNGHTATVAARTGITYGTTGAIPDSTGLALDGTQGAAVVTSPITVFNGTPGSIEFWLTPVSISAGLVLGTTTDGYGVVMGTSLGGGVLHLSWEDTADAGVDHIQTATLVAGVRHHFVLTYDGVNAFKWYKDGVADGTFTLASTGVTISALFTDGANAASASLFDEVAIYPTALAPATITAHYAARTSRQTYTDLVHLASPTAYWKLENPAGPKVGELVNISDSTTATYGAAVAGSGTNHVLARWDGNNWIVLGGAGGATDSPTFTRVLVGDGTLAAPAVAFSSSSGSGLYNALSGVSGIANSGVYNIAFGYNGTGLIQVPAAGGWVWNSTSAAAGALDTGLTRVSAGVVGVGTGAQGSVAGTISALHAILGGSFTSIGGIASSGNFGVPLVEATGRFNAQVAAKASVSAVTVGGADGTFEVSANVNVTTATTHNFSVTCVYTDETNVSRTLTFGFTQLTGSTFISAITNITGAGPYESPVYHIRAKTGTTITIASTGTFTTVAYNIEGIIKQVA